MLDKWVKSFDKGSKNTMTLHKAYKCEGAVAQRHIYFSPDSKHLLIATVLKPPPPPYSGAVAWNIKYCLRLYLDLSQ